MYRGSRKGRTDKERQGVYGANTALVSSPCKCVEEDEDDDEEDEEDEDEDEEEDEGEEEDEEEEEEEAAAAAAVAAAEAVERVAVALTGVCCGGRCCCRARII